jgi:NAD(P)-dependent dehydrogenase (short-subunit alcohol dehydrogenase family)
VVTLRTPVNEELRAALDAKLLEGRTVLLTGAAGGIGRAVADALSRSGATVVAVDLPGSPLANVVDEIRLGGREAYGFEADVAQAGSLDGRLAQFTRLYGVVNCAGLWNPEPFDEINDESLQETLLGNLITTFQVCKTVVPLLTEQGAGSIVNFSSTAGEYGSIRPAAHYAAAKAGVIGLTKSLAREVAPFNVRVNAISPGPIDTLALGAETPEARAAAAERTLFKRLGQPEDIAGGCIFLLSPLSSFVTGHVLRVNGGSLL